MINGVFFSVRQCRELYMSLKDSTSLLEGCRCLERAGCCAAVDGDSLLQIVLSKNTEGKMRFSVIGEHPSGTCNLEQMESFQWVWNRNIVSRSYLSAAKY